MGLGPVRTFSLVEARERARQIRQQLMQNIDPLSARDADRAKRQRDNAAVFKICVAPEIKPGAFAVLTTDTGKSEDLPLWRFILRPNREMAERAPSDNLDGRPVRHDYALPDDQRPALAERDD